MVKEYEKAHPNVKVVLNQIENNAYKTKIQVAMAGGSPPDIFFSWGYESLFKFVNARLVTDLTKSVGAQKSIYIPALLKGTTLKGKIYGLPLESGVGGVWYNKDLFAKYNLSEPKTWNEFINVCDTLKKNGVSPLTGSMKDAWTGLQTYMYLVDRMGGENAFEKAAARKGHFSGEAFVKANQVILDLVKKGYFNENALGVNWGEGQQLMASGKTGMYVMGSWLYGILSDMQPNTKWGFFPFPQIAGGKGNPSNLTGGLGAAFSVSAKCKNKKEAIALVKLLCSEKNEKEFFKMTNTLASTKTFMPENAPATMKEVVGYMSKANNMQMWHDQVLPAPVASAELEMLQQLFGGAVSAQEGAKKLEEVATQEMGPVKK
ncbi:MAG TPA: extracellular solute-binding protein [Bacillota bacterium]|nr:extracellular solute-binding protein [Bacillota bacterium]